MRLDISPESAATVETFARIPSSFEVRSVFEVNENGKSVREIVLTERPYPLPYTKNYDAVTEENPSAWLRRFDLSHWGLFGAHLRGVRIGAAAVVRGFPIPDDESDVATLWDIRVSPEHRNEGVGAAMFRAAEDWARARSCRELRIETQNNNVSAVKFYLALGCSLHDARRNAYPEFPTEVQLIFTKTL